MQRRRWRRAASAVRCSRSSLRRSRSSATRPLAQSRTGRSTSCSPRHRLLPFLGLALLTLAACNENLAGGAACPSLCPGQQLEVHDTVLVASALFDTTALVNGMPPL